MNRTVHVLLTAVVIAAALFCAPCVAHACSVPVFRYALDHWTPDAYRIRILHQGPLTAEHAAVVEHLQNQVGARFANAIVEVLDMQDLDDPDLAARFEEADTRDAPLCVVQAPTGVSGVYRDVWSGPLAAETVEALLVSPAREQLVKLLLAGTSVVWIYLDSGVTPVDDSNYRLIETELTRLEGELELPEIDPADLKELSTSPEDVKLKFSALRLSRDNPEEFALVEMLLSSEPDLRDGSFINEPMAFPVFGRGRVLYSLVGKGITAELVEDACRFLTGACQCTVKEQNPGVDLLLSVEWDGLISPSAPTDVEVTLTGLAGFQSDTAGVAATDIVAADPAETEPLPDSGTVPEARSDWASLSGADTQTTDDPSPTPDSDVPNAATIELRPDRSFAAPIVLIAVLGLIVVVGSFFLIPRQ